MRPTFDVAVAGAGPAGTALVAALSKLGLKVAWIAPNISEVWPNTYGVWCDELEGICSTGVFKHVWDGPMVYTSCGSHSLTRPYGLVDNEALRAELLSGCHNITEFDARVVVAQTWGFELDQGGEVAATVLFDATGHRTKLQNREGNPGYQTAYGMTVEVEGTPFEHSMALMDFRPPEGPWEGPPTFLYAMKLSDTRWFLEETVLVARPAIAISSLKDRLYARLEERGVEVTEVLHEERCLIPMGDGLPSFDERRATPFGAAASFVHPATGYMLSNTLRRAAGVAAAAHEFVTGPQTVERFVHEAVWPDDRIATRRFFEFGMETLLHMDEPVMAGFLTPHPLLRPFESWRI